MKLYGIKTSKVKMQLLRIVFAHINWPRIYTQNVVFNVCRMILLITLVSACVSCNPSVDMVFNNRQNESIDSIIIDVGGEVFSMGRINKKDKGSIEIASKSESNVKAFIYINNEWKSVDIECYLEPNYSGTIRVDLYSKDSIDVDCEISISSISLR